MDNRTIVECKELVLLKSKLLSLAKLVSEYTDKVKSLKAISKLVKLERKGLKTCKAPIATADLNSLIWAYGDLAEIIKILATSKKAEIVGKASSDLDALINKTETEVASLKQTINPEADSLKKFSDVIGNTAQALSKKIGAGAQKLGSVVSETIGEKVEEIKKMIAGDEEN